MSTTAIPGIRSGQVIVTGSLAFDNIMDFPDAFKDHILPDKLHVINISFLVEKLTRQRGGCAGNIAYTMALLKTPPKIVAAVGPDFTAYRAWLQEHAVDTSGIRTFEDEITASCFITTDKMNCQITGFFVGAMKRAREIKLREVAGDAALCLVAPDDPGAISRHTHEAREMGLPFLFDPSFQVTAMDGPSLAAAAEGAVALFLNDYEFSVFQSKTGQSAEDVRQRHEFLVVTLGEKGSQILLRDGETISVPAARVDEVVDPTGAGDAYRGAFVAGLMAGFDLPTCAQMGSVGAVYAIENYGTQSHAFDRDEFFSRYEKNFGPLPGPQRTTPHNGRPEPPTPSAT